MKKKTGPQLKKELDQVFSRWVRVSNADKDGMVACYTCGVVKHYKQMHNGHFISRQYLAVRFDPRNTRPQCPGCNLYGNGKPVEFARKLELEMPGVTMELYREAQKIVKNYPYLEQIALYQSKLDELNDKATHNKAKRKVRKD